MFKIFYIGVFLIKLISAIEIPFLELIDFDNVWRNVTSYKSSYEEQVIYSINQTGILVDCKASFMVEWTIEMFQGITSQKNPIRKKSLKDLTLKNPFMETNFDYYISMFATDFKIPTIGRYICRSVENHSHFSSILFFVDFVEESGLYLYDGNPSIENENLIPHVSTNPFEQPKLSIKNKNENKETEMLPEFDYYYDHIKGFYLTPKIMRSVPNLTFISSMRSNERLEFEFKSLLAQPSSGNITFFVDEAIEFNCKSLNKINEVELTVNSLSFVQNKTVNKIGHKKIFIKIPNEQKFKVTCKEILNSVSVTWNVTVLFKPKIRIDNKYGSLACLTPNPEKTATNIICKNPTTCMNQQLRNVIGFTSGGGVDCIDDTSVMPYTFTPCIHAFFGGVNGMLKCSVVDAFVYFQYFTGLRSTKHTYWGNVKKHDLIAINEISPILYANNTVEFFCEIVSFLFTENIYFYIVRNNGEKQLYLADKINSSDDREVRDLKYAGTLNIKLPIDAVEVICLAPWTNSSEWINTSRKFDVKYLKTPEIILTESSKPNVTFYLNRENYFLNCVAKGEPTPEFSWKRRTLNENSHNSSTYSYSDLDENIFKIRTGKYSSILEISSVKESQAGEYECMVKNINGIANITFNVAVKEPSNYVLIAVLITISILIAIIPIIYYFIRKHRILKLKLRDLSEKEIEEFFNGIPEQYVPESDHFARDEAHVVPYNNAYEISTNDIKIDKGKVLGAGKFGLVRLGHLGNVNVAVKTTKPNAEISYFKSLLKELKTTMHIGQHENIVSFIGACTEKIRERVLYVVIEFCPLGNLESYLKNNKNTFKDFLISYSNISNESYANIKHTMSSLNLVIWSGQICNGMAYLAERKVVHADLATRNVLLVNENLAKITDFGLSKQLYAYSQYNKKMNTIPLPWRWMAIESLKNMTFSTESDIWSFGVTVWEIFSLAEIPFPNFTWTIEFHDLLDSGLRLRQPKYASKEIYNEMKKCWDDEPKKRPSFAKLRKFFQDQVQIYDPEIYGNIYAGK